MPAGNNLNAASGITLNPSTQSFSDDVSFGLPDFYRFTLSSRSSVSLALTGLTADANLELLNSTGAAAVDASGAAIPASTNGGTLPDFINAVLAPGTYVIRVTPGPASDPLNPSTTTPATPYTLGVSADNGIQGDIAWRNVNTGDTYVWGLTNGVRTTDVQSPTINGGWVYQTGGSDFNGDGMADIVLRNLDPNSPDFGKSGVWYMNGATRIGSAISNFVVPDANWKIVGAGDLDGNGQTDWVWSNKATNQIAIWFLNGVTTITTPILDGRGADWSIQAVGDFNNDGKADIVWRNTTTGADEFWFMNGTTVIGTSATIPIADPNWEIRGSADYNQDGNADLLWRNKSTGENVIWFMNGTTRLSDLYLPTQSDTTWQSFALSGREPLSLHDIAGNTAATALNLGNLTGSGIFSGAIGTNNSADYYQFTLGGASRVSLSFSGAGGGPLTGDLDLTLTNSTGVPLVTFGQVALTPESANTNVLPAGTYTVRIAPKSGSSATSAYQLGLGTLPALVNDIPVTLNEGAAQTISSSSLLVSDGAKPAAVIVYTVVTSPNATAGALLLSGAAITTGNTFTQADINSGRLSYRQSGSEAPLTDSFVFSVTTGTGPLAGTLPPTAFSLNFLPVNDPPVLLTTNPSLTLTEGTAIALTSTLLSATDVEQGPAQLIYTLNTAPANGAILRSGVALTTGGTFSQADINTGTLLSYSHNGSETLSDGFTFTLSDGAGGLLTPPTRSLSINVIPFDDPPVLLTNAGLQVSSGGSQLISTTLLSATDVDTVSDRIIYSITSAPTNGTLFRGQEAQITTFTQADLVNQRIVYGHNGSQTNSDSFTFTLIDQGSTVPGPTGTFNITVAGVNFIPVLATTNPRLTLNEGASATIGTSVLQVSDADSAPPQLTYTLISAPVNGTLNKFGTPLTANATFLQSDIDTNGRITYVNNGSTTTRDSFIFAVSDQTGGRLGNQTFSIFVTPVNNPPVLLTDVGLTLNEGATTQISTSLLSATDVDNLPSQVTYLVTAAPTVGTLLVAGTPINGSFTQAQLNGGQLSYRHDGSESITDSFAFTLTDGIATVPGTFNITVNPVNDPPVLVSNTGVTLAQGGVVTIDGTELLVTDVDGPLVPIYTVGSAPASGTLLLNGTALTTGGTFTQADLNTNAITYQHNDSQTLKDRFTFTGSDGGNGLIPLKTFSITVTPVNHAPTLTVPGTITVNEDTAFTFNSPNRLIATDVDSPTLTVQLTALNGNLNLVGATGNGTGSVALNGSATVINNAFNSMRYQGLPNYNGPDAITVSVSDGQFTQTQTITVNVAPVNDPPVLTVPGAQSVLEDASLSFANLITLTDIDSPTLNVTLTVSTNGTLNVASEPSLAFLGGTANGGNTLSLTGTVDDLQLALSSLTYQGQLNYNGKDNLTIAVQDLGGDGIGAALPVLTRSVPITIQAVNDAPTFTPGAAVVEVNEDAPAYSQLWATSANPGGGPDEKSQVLTYVVTNDQSSLFTATGQPTINANGFLTFTLAKDANTAALGPANVTVSLRDNGGTLNGGINTSAPSTFSIVVDPVNDPPTFVSTVTTISSREDAGPQSVLWASNISAGPANEIGQTVAFTLETISTTNPNLFVTAPSLDAATGLLTYQAAPNANGVAVIRATLIDNGGIDNGFGGGGVDRTSKTLTINVTAVNDPPSLTLPSGPLVVDEDTRLAIPDITLTDVDAGTSPIQVTLAVTNGTLSLGSAPTTGITITGNNSRSVTVRGSQSALAPVLATLSYQGNLNFAGTAGTPADNLTVTANDFGATGATSGTTISTQSIGIVVNPVNDPPTLTVPTTTVSVQEDTNITITGIRSTDVDSNSLVFTVSALNGNLTLGSQIGSTVTTTLTPAVANSGLSGLIYRGTQDYNGPDTLTVSVSDGSADPVLRTISVNVIPVNDPPVLTVPASVPAVPEGTPIVFANDSAISITDVDSPNLTVGLAVKNGTISLASLDGLTVVRGTNGSASVTYSGPQALVNSALNNVSYVPTQYYNGTDTLTITASDGSTGATGIAAPKVVSLTITPVNNPPVLVRNGTLVVTEGNTPVARTINTSLLSYTDPDTAAANVVYTVVTGTANGTLKIGTSTVTSFTQADLAAGRLTYTHNGSETTSDSFVFQVSDGDPANLLAPATFSISVIPVNDAPVLQTTSPGISVKSGTAQVVVLSGANSNQPNQLLATDVDTPVNQLVYTLITTPDVTFGTLLKSGASAPLAAGSSFTQADINSGAISYSYNGTPNGSDSILLQLSDGTTSFIVPLNVTLT